MRNRLLLLALTLSLTLAGCRSWNVNAFGVPVGQGIAYASVANTPKPAPRDLGHHAALSYSSLTKEEKTATIVVLIAAAAAIAAVIIAVS